MFEFRECQPYVLRDVTSCYNSYIEPDLIGYIDHNSPLQEDRVLLSCVMFAVVGSFLTDSILSSSRLREAHSYRNSCLAVWQSLPQFKRPYSRSTLALGRSILVSQISNLPINFLCMILGSQRHSLHPNHFFAGILVPVSHRTLQCDVLQN